MEPGTNSPEPNAHRNDDLRLAHLRSALGDLGVPSALLEIAGDTPESGWSSARKVPEQASGLVPPDFFGELTQRSQAHTPKPIEDNEITA